MWHVAIIYLMSRALYASRMETNPPKRAIQDADKFMLRLPDGMRDQIATLAKENKRSLNAEFVARIEASLRPSGTSETPPEIVKEIARQAAHVLASRDEHVRMLEGYFQRSAHALAKAVGLLAKCHAPAGELADLEAELAGVQYFLRIVEEGRSAI